MWSDNICFFGTEDLQKTHDFYSLQLGLTLERDQGICHIYRVPGGGGLGFCSHMPVVQREKSPIITLITDDVDAVYLDLLKEGLEPLHAPQENPKFLIYHFFVRDPNGYLVEVQKFLDS